MQLATGLLPLARIVDLFLTVFQVLKHFELFVQSFFIVSFVRAEDLLGLHVLDLIVGFHRFLDLLELKLMFDAKVDTFPLVFFDASINRGLDSGDLCLLILLFIFDSFVRLVVAIQLFQLRLGLATLL